MGYGRREVISRMGPEDRDLWEGLSREQGMARIAADGVEERARARIAAAAKADPGIEVGPCHHLDTCPGDCGEEG